MNPNSYWSRMIKKIYFPNSSFLAATRGKKASWAWLSLLKGREILVQGLRRQVGDGHSISFWEDKWVPSLPNFRISFPKPTKCDIYLVSDAIIPGLGVWKF